MNYPLAEQIIRRTALQDVSTKDPVILELYDRVEWIADECAIRGRLHSAGFVVVPNDMVEHCVAIVEERLGYIQSP